MQLLLLIGPPAVGKMTIGRQIAASSNFRLFHNHHTIEPLDEVFGYGTPAFNILNAEFRNRVVAQAAEHQVDLIFTFVWGLDVPEDVTSVRELVAPYTSRGAQISVAELTAPLEVRLRRNHGADRIAAKPTKKNLEWSDQNVRELDSHALNTTDPSVVPEALELIGGWRHRIFDTTGGDAGHTAQAVLDWLEETD